MLRFDRERFHSRIVLPDGAPADRLIEIRTHPITGRTCRITYSRGEEREPGAETLPAPPPFAGERDKCPFCPARVSTSTPRLPPELCAQGRMTRGTSTLFPNLFPYGRYSAVSLFDEAHFVEIGTATLQSYTDSLLNCRDYLLRVLAYDSEAIFMAITQNHLPSAGGSMIHPHLQVQADRTPANCQRFLRGRAMEYRLKRVHAFFPTTCSMRSGRGSAISAPSAHGIGWPPLLPKPFLKYGAFCPASAPCGRFWTTTGGRWPGAS